MELTYINNKLDVTKEHELMSDTEFGFIVTVKAIDDTDSEILYNCTEVHHLYRSRQPSIAFESHIHHTGGTKRIEELISVDIQIADKLYETFWG